MIKIVVIEPNKQDHFFIEQALKIEKDHFLLNNFDDCDIFFISDVDSELHFRQLPLCDAILYSGKNQQSLENFALVKSFYSSIPIVVYGDSESSDKANFFLESGATDYVILGYYPGTLIKKIIFNSVEKNKYLNKIYDLENKVEQLKSKNDVVSKFAALGEVTANIAHEINTPLSTILINVEYIQSDLKNTDFDAESIEKMLAVISKTCFRIADIVKALREFAKRKDGAGPAIIDMIRVVGEAIELFSYKIKSSGIEVSFKYNKQISYMVNGLFVELFLVVVNLLNNSFDAICDNSEQWICVELWQDETNIYIQVSDSGLGIPKEIQKKIFEPFFTTKIGQGIGLGLNVCEKIILRHGGKIYLDTTSRNTKFIIELPLSSKKEPT